MLDSLSDSFFHFVRLFRNAFHSFLQCFETSRDLAGKYYYTLNMATACIRWRRHWGNSNLGVKNNGWDGVKRLAGRAQGRLVPFTKLD